MRSNISNALELSSRFGWKLFPAKPVDKSPYINGWQQRATAGVGQKYGSGYGLEAKARWMERIVVC